MVVVVVKGKGLRPVKADIDVGHGRPIAAELSLQASRKVDEVEGVRAKLDGAKGRRRLLLLLLLLLLVVVVVGVLVPSFQIGRLPAPRQGNGDLAKVRQDDVVPVRAGVGAPRRLREEAQHLGGLAGDVAPHQARRAPQGHGQRFDERPVLVARPSPGRRRQQADQQRDAGAKGLKLERLAHDEPAPAAAPQAEIGGYQAPRCGDGRSAAVLVPSVSTEHKRQVQQLGDEKVLHLCRLLGVQLRKRLVRPRRLVPPAVGHEGPAPVELVADLQGGEVARLRALVPGHDGRGEAAHSVLERAERAVAAAAAAVVVVALRRRAGAWGGDGDGARQA